MLQKGTTLEHDKYRIEGVIGRGGFGYVYRARERLTGETVAIKELIPGLGDREMVQRFIREARATLRLTHPRIARTYGIFQDHGTYYLAMEYLPGGSLSDRLKKGPLPMEEAVRIAIDLCDALDHAHRGGVVHCDIKPANVLFDERGRVRLADFGIAHVSEQMMTRRLFTAPDRAMGTVRYMAPEQLEGVREDRRVDIYAMGAVLYEMLAGRPYLDFETDTTPAAQMRNVQRIQSQPPRPLRAVNPAVPTWLARVVERALRKAPGERFATAEEMREALRGKARREEGRVSSPPKSAPAPSSRPKDRTTWLWVAGGLLSVLGVACCLVAILSGALSGGGGIGALMRQATDTPTPSLTPAPTATPTPTPRPSATPTSTPVPTPTPMPTPEILVLYDTFDANDNDWGTGTRDNEWWKGTKSIAAGRFIWDVDEVYKDVIHHDTPISAPDDFHIAVDAQRTSGSVDTACYGLLYREGEKGYYKFRVCDDQYYEVSLWYEGEWRALIDWTKSLAIRPGEVNNLAVNAVGSHFEFFINDQFVRSTDDDTLSGGDVGIAVSMDEGDEAVFEFDDFVLRRPHGTPSTTQTLLVQDPFDVNDNGWSTGARDDEWWRGARSITDGKYVWRVDEVYKDFMQRDAPIHAPDDFYISVDARRISGSISEACYGLAYREDKEGFYRFRVCDSQYYYVSLWYEDEWQMLVDWTESSAIRSGEVNNLAVNAVGSHFEFFINDQFVGSTDDETLSGGDVGVFVEADEGDVAVFEFDNFVLRTP